jgi:uncharacterized protein involved in exopolysaccharide biosynthesis
MSHLQQYPESKGQLRRDLVTLGEDDQGDFSLLGTVAFVLRHVRVLFVIPVACAVLALVLVLFLGRSYNAMSQILPERAGGGGLDRYSSLASQFGVSLPSGLVSQSPDFYAAVAKSPELLRALANSGFEFVDDGERIEGTLIELLEIERPTPHRTQLGAVKYLQGAIRTSSDATTGILEIETEAKWAPLAEMINRRILELIADFDDRRRQRLASAERTFVEGRLVQVEEELRGAEADLRQFLEQNRDYESSPQLTLTVDRLRRVVSLRQQVYTGLAQALEQARIEEVRNTPQLTIVTHPEGTADRPRLRRSIIVGGLIGVVLAVLAALAREWLTRERARNPDDYAALRDVGIAGIYKFLVGRHPRSRSAGHNPA